MKGEEIITYITITLFGVGACVVLYMMAVFIVNILVAISRGLII